MSFVSPGNVKKTAAPSLLRFITLILCLMPLAPAVTGQTGSDAAPSPLPSGVQVRIRATPQVATVGDPIHLDLEIAMPAGFQAEILEPENQTGDFTVLEFLPGPALEDEGAPQDPAAPVQPQTGAPSHHRARIIAALYRTGTFTFPPLQIRLRTPEGKQITASSPPAKVVIQSVLEEKNRELKDLKKQAEIPEPARALFRLMGLLLLCVACAVAWILWKRRRKPAPSHAPPPPLDLLAGAEAKLRDLLARGLPEDRHVKQFYVRLSEIVKEILEAAYAIHKAERTTSEIVDALRRGPGHARENHEKIESFLVRCDVVKFAKYVPSKAEHDSSAADALQILESSRQWAARGAQPAAADSLPAAECRPAAGDGERIP